MKRLCFAVATTFLCLAACDVTQELQGDGLDEAGSTPASDGGTTTRDSGGSNATADAAPPSSDGGADAPTTTRQVSICTPTSAIGTTSVAVDGSESDYFRDVDDIASGAGKAFVLSGPWTFVGVPLGGGSPIAYDITATLPNFLAFAIAPVATNPSGALTAAALATYNLPTGDGQIVALGGSRSTASEIGGRVLLDGGDVFYFQTAPPSRLVHAATSANPSERLVVEYETASGRVVTAAALVGTYVYFATVSKSGGSPSQAMLHRSLRAGGSVEDLISSGLDGQIEGIYEDAGTLYLTPGGEQGSVGTFVAMYTIASGALRSGNLQGMSESIAYTRTSGVAFDGSAFYYGAGTGTGCAGKLVRVGKSVVRTNVGNAEVLASNLDRISRVRVLEGALFVGTSGDPFFQPVAYPGQMLRWTP